MSNFCHVIKINASIQFIPSITLGNQNWNGAVPLFINKEDKIIILILLFSVLLNIKLFLYMNKIVENNKTEEAKAWVKKYFKEASLDIKLLSFIGGINDNKLISNPIQEPNQELAEIVIIVLIIKIKKNKFFDELLKIKKKRIKTFINGVWAQ